MGLASEEISSISGIRRGSVLSEVVLTHSLRDSIPISVPIMFPGSEIPIKTVPPWYLQMNRQ